jgi:hypothetical protein
MSFHYSPKIVTDGLMLYVDAANYKSIVSGDTTWNDISKTGDDGTLVNGPTYNPNNNGSILFDGLGDYVNFSELTPANTLNTFSFGLWFSPAITITSGSLATFSVLMEAQDQRFASSRADNYIYFLTNGELLFATFSPTNDLVSQQTTWDSDEWYQVFCTYEPINGEKKLFINGELENSVTGVTGNYFNTFTHFGLGAYNETTIFSPTNAFNGDISNFMVYDKTLSEQEVLQNYNALKSRYDIL